MRRITFDDMKPGMTVFLKEGEQLFETTIIHTTKGHLMELQEVRIANGQLYNYRDVEFFHADPENKTEILLEGTTLEQDKLHHIMGAKK